MRALLRQARHGGQADQAVEQMLQTIDAMSAQEQQDPAWRYWKARALQVTALDNGTRPAARRADAHLAQARQLLEALAGEMHFYGALAAEDLGRPLRCRRRRLPLAPRSARRTCANPGLGRALQLIGDRPAQRRRARVEFHVARHARPRTARRGAMGLRSRSLGSLHQHQRTHGQRDRHRQRYPMPFRNEVVAQTREIGIDPAYVYGLIRQESRFVMNARSHVGASGLMQLMPATARWTANKLGLSYSADQIDDRATNLLLGTSYLKLVLDEAGGQQALGAAAYNAGPGRMRRWRDGPPIEPAVWAESIPFTETRDYVKKVLSNAQYYAARLGTAKCRRCGPALGPPIGSRNPSLPQPRELP